MKKTVSTNPTVVDVNRILELLHNINDEVQRVHPDDDDDTGAIVYNCCYAIAEELGLKW